MDWNLCELMKLNWIYNRDTVPPHTTKLPYT